MTPSELFKAGRLQEALQAQLQEVKAKPADQGLRLFLFELALFAGDLDRARRQLEAIHYEGDAALEMTKQLYLSLLAAEQLRRRTFDEGVRPKFLGEIPVHASLRLDALDCLRQGRAPVAAELIARANQETTSVSGTLNGKPFTALRDEDDVLGPILEVLANGSYFWIPLSEVKCLTASKPRYPRDLFWLPVRLETSEGEAPVFLPVLYAGSHLHADEAVQLGRMTDWLAADGGPVRGAGMHSFLADEDAVGVLEWRELSVN